MSDNFSSMLKYLRERAGISQAGLAKAIGVTPASIGLYEQGRRQPAFEIEEKIADYFNVDLNTLRGITSDNYTKEEKELVTSYRKLSHQQKTVLRYMLYALALSDDTPKPLDENSYKNFVLDEIAKLKDNKENKDVG